MGFGTGRYLPRPIGALYWLLPASREPKEMTDLERRNLRYLESHPALALSEQQAAHVVYVNAYGRSLTEEEVAAVSRIRTRHRV